MSSTETTTTVPRPGGAADPVASTPTVPGPVAAYSSTAPTGRRARAARIDDWRPEDERFWVTTGARVARRNLACSIFSEHIGFCVWSLWSIFVLFLGPDYGLDPGKKFLLTSIPSAVGALLRVPYTLAVARFGGRTWTVVSALVLLIPTLFAAATIRPGVSFTTLLIGAALAGIGGGNFSSSMANIESFYPMRLKGWALGMNAGGGNLGVAVAQLVGLGVLATAGATHPRLILAVFIPLIVVSALASARFMDNLPGVRNEPRAMRDAARRGHTWIICGLYICTFGSFIGFAFAFGQVLQIEFADTFDSPVKAAYLTFLGPLVGSLIRPVGGRLADRFGGATVSSGAFATMAVGGLGIVAATGSGSLPLFLVAFLALFALTGIGNGSVYKLIPTVFRAMAVDDVAVGIDPIVADRRARQRTRAVIGIAGAVGTFGGVLINVALRQSFLATGSARTAFVGFVGAYALSAVVAWVVYVRPERRSS